MFGRFMQVYPEEKKYCFILKVLAVISLSGKTHLLLNEPNAVEAIWLF